MCLCGNACDLQLSFPKPQVSGLTCCIRITKLKDMNVGKVAGGLTGLGDVLEVQYIRLIIELSFIL